VYSERFREFGALADEQASDPMYGKRCLLVLGFDRNEPHAHAWSALAPNDAL